MNKEKQARLAYTEKAQKIVDDMTLEQKVKILSGTISIDDMMKALMTGVGHYNDVPYPSGGDEEHGVPTMRFCDGPRGVVCGTGKATCFPVSMCRGASFDAGLEEEIGHAIGREVRGFGGNLFAGVCINLPYNPGWGRSQEVYGEESFHLGQMGSALVRGVQGEHVMACTKHYAFNSMENARFKVSVDCSRRTEREVYLPHFKDCVDAGTASVMSSYNLYKGIKCGYSDYLLKKVLKEEWDFDGFVMTDFVWGVDDTVKSANYGQDMEMPGTIYYGEKLIQAVKDGLVPELRINESVLRIIRTILTYEDAYNASGKNYDEEVLGSKEHIALALRAAQEGMVLMQNNNSALPLNKNTVKKIAVIGKLGEKANIGDHGSSQVFPAYVVTPIEGLNKVMPNAEVVYCDGSDIAAAKKAAKEADAAIFVVGYDHDDEGEFISGEEGTNYTGSIGGDRKKSLGLSSEDVELIKQAGPENKNSVAVLIGGNMIMTTEWKDSVSAILMAFYPGQEGGTAIAQVLCGDMNPSGKLPFVLPYDEKDLPQVNWETTNQYYDYYHGYTRLEKQGIKPLLPYGFGLSYTTFDVSNASFAADANSVKASCTVKNTGAVAGTEVVQLYVGFKNSKIDRPVKLLRGFGRVELQPGESKKVELTCPLEKLKYFNEATNDFELERMEHEVYIGTSSANSDLLQGTVTIG
ncbi:glycoside hydrolase family 3 C-terminal domain-containing protein [Christensenellaceae bacterium OttesenSCG-928-K19]|nr:glycoside hydrolase family 3 C-terminal domain-containing protein [Christensenellaceae bacterium OttesenSCG-928-K19]